jgi:hypothetical protein
MIIDSKTFTELAVHLRIASDAILKTATHMGVISARDARDAADPAWDGTIDSMLAISTQLRVMDRLLFAVLDANRQEAAQDIPEGGLPS